MSELNPQEPVPAKPGEPKKKKKGAPTWVWFIGTFAIVSLVGNVVFGGNTWITASSNFVTVSLNSLFPDRDTSKDAFCLTGEVTDIDRSNALFVVAEAVERVTNTTGAIGFAAQAPDLEQLVAATSSVHESTDRYLVVGERLLTAKNCADPTFEYLMQDFGGSLVDMSENFSQWGPETPSSNLLLLITATSLIESAATQAQALITYIESSK
jgi:hypothetical protein